MTQIQRYLEEINEGYTFYELGKDPFGWMAIALLSVAALGIFILERIFS